MGVVLPSLGWILPPQLHTSGDILTDMARGVAPQGFQFSQVDTQKEPLQTQTATEQSLEATKGEPPTVPRSLSSTELCKLRTQSLCVHDIDWRQKPND